MAIRKVRTPEQTVLEDMPGFQLAAEPRGAEDAAPHGADAIAPAIEKMKGKYFPSRPGDPATTRAELRKASKPPKGSAPPKTPRTKMLVVEPAAAGAEPAKKLTVLVRDGKIVTRQG